MEQFLLITLLLNFDGTVVTGNHENGFPPKALVSEAECRYLKYQNEFIRPPVGLRYLSTAYLCETKTDDCRFWLQCSTMSVPRPAGFYVASLREQVSEGDPRIILSTSDEFYLCTRPAATPDMDTSKALLLMHERIVKYLFVPVIRRGTRSSS